MFLFTLSPRQASILLPFFLCLPIQVSSLKLGLRDIGSYPDDDNGDQAPTRDGPTSTDKSAGSERNPDGQYSRIKRQNISSLYPSAYLPAHDSPPKGKMPPAQDAPVCDHTITYSLGDTMELQKELNDMGNNADNNNCCTSPSGDCEQLKYSGGTAVHMCGPTGHAQQCAGCANVAIALNALNIDCTKDYQIGGTVGIPYLDGVTLQFVASHTT